jgi:hypothetical protein
MKQQLEFSVELLRNSETAEGKLKPEPLTR